MALSTCSGRDEGYKLVVRVRFEAGIQELVCFTQHLLEAEADPDAHGKIRERIEAASREMSAAEEELGRQLKTVDATTEELVAKKKSLQDEQEEKKRNLERLRIQLNSCRESEREAREMLERANRQLGEMQAELQRQRAEADSNRLVRDIGIGLMFIPLLGTIAVELAPELGPLENVSSEVQRQVNGEDPMEDVPDNPKQEDTSVCLLDCEDGKCTSDSCQKQEAIPTDRQNNLTDFINVEPEGDIGHWFNSKVRRRGAWKIIAAVVATVLAVLLIAVIVGSVSKASVTPPDSPAACCPENWIGYQGKCYLFSERVANWTSSQHSCSSYGAFLAWLDTLQEKDFLMQYKDYLDAWIGLRREPGQPWKWANGSIFNHLFRIGEGGECAYMYKNTISSSGCYIKRNWICSKPNEFAKRKIT